MFTGLVAAVGSIVQVDALAPEGDGGGGVRLRVQAAGFGREQVAPGDSIAVQGVCLTALEPGDDTFLADVSRESLSCTVGLDRLGPVNLERALTLADRLGGHLVSGHVDGVGVIHALTPVRESVLFQVDVPQVLAAYVSRKGSLTVDGVSLTVNAVEDLPAAGVCRVSINLIPHTVAVTTLGNRKPGDRVNLEIDMIARYLERMLAVRDGQAGHD